jgi:Secretory lipase
MHLGKRSTVALVCALTVIGFGVVSALAAASSTSGPPLPSGDPFYSYHHSLAHIAPGTILKTRTIKLANTSAGEPTQATQVLYRTTGELGQRTVTVATIIRPLAAGPTKIVSFQTAYDALGDQCDPSYTLRQGSRPYSLGNEEESVILGYVKAGDTAVVSDYEGEGLDWIAGQESGYGTLDAIRAAERTVHARPATTPVAMFGYSGGSVATEFASELARSYSPKLHIVGVAEGGIPVDLFHLTKYINGSPYWSATIPATLVSLSRAFHTSLRHYLSAYGVKVTGQVSHQCITNFLGAYPGLTYQKLLKRGNRDLLKIPTVTRFLDHLIMSRTGTPKGPLFMGVGDSDGTGDGVMVTKDVEALAHTYCKRGVSVQFHVYTGEDHGQAAVSFEGAAPAFIAARLNGESVPNGCGSIGRGNSLAPVPIPRRAS